MPDNGDKLSEADRKPVEEAIADLEGAIEKEDSAAIKAGTERLERESQKLATVLYQSTGTAAGPNPGEPGPSASGAAEDDDVIEAEVVDSGDGKSGN